jgi:ribosomal protein S18 acetylase RimI-like enzyme
VSDGSRIVAWGALRGYRAEIDVHPGVRGRGIGAALLGWSERRAKAGGRPLVRQTVTDNDHPAASLFRSRGYGHAHTAWILEIALGDEPYELALPAGVAIRPYRADDARATHRLIDDAFSEWAGRDAVSFEDWAPFATAHGAFAPDLSRLAFDGGDLVGAAVVFDYPSADEGWVQQLATKASHRHRGIARALLSSVFAAFHTRGRGMVALSTDSRTGALSLYERLGMRIRRSYTGWAKDLS